MMPRTISSFVCMITVLIFGYTIFMIGHVFAIEPVLLRFTTFLCVLILWVSFLLWSGGIGGILVWHLCTLGQDDLHISDYRDFALQILTMISFAFASLGYFALYVMSLYEYPSLEILTYISRSGEASFTATGTVTPLSADVWFEMYNVAVATPQISILIVLLILFVTAYLTRPEAEK